MLEKPFNQLNTIFFKHVNLKHHSQLLWCPSWKKVIRKTYRHLKKFIKPFSNPFQKFANLINYKSDCYIMESIKCGRQNRQYSTYPLMFITLQWTFIPMQIWKIWYWQFQSQRYYFQWLFFTHKTTDHKDFKLLMAKLGSDQTWMINLVWVNDAWNIL